MLAKPKLLSTRKAHAPLLFPSNLRAMDVEGLYTAQVSADTMSLPDDSFGRSLLVDIFAC